MLTKIYAENPSERELSRVVAVLEHDGVIVCPTDSVYAFACSIRSARAIERLRRMLGKSETRFSALFPDIARVAEYCRVDNAVFRVLKRNLPGPFTFILTHLSQVPDKALARRRTLGVRIPDHAVARAVAEALGAPLLVASVHDDCETEYTTDPELIAERYGDRIDLVIDGGPGNSVPTTVVDLTQDEPLVLREGRGELA